MDPWVIFINHPLEHSNQKEAKKVACECCKKKFVETSILRHIAQTEICKKHYGPRLDEQKKINNKDRVQKHRQNNGTKRDTCEYCNKKVSDTTILRHISQSKDCKSYYGPRFDQQKRDDNKERVRKFRKQHGTKKELDQQKKAYASNPDLQEKQG